MTDTPTPIDALRCAECDCEDGGDNCTWFAAAAPTDWRARAAHSGAELDKALHALDDAETALEKAEAERDALRAKLAEAAVVLRECADELEANVDADWPESIRAQYTHCQIKYDQDMEPVRRARAILAKIGDTND